MSDSFDYLDEPQLSFGLDQTTEDPHDGLSLFGPSDRRNSLPDHIVIGTESGNILWQQWAAALNEPASCKDISRHRAWPPYCGFDVAFGTRWQAPIKIFSLDSRVLRECACKADRYERAYSVANLYIEPLAQVQRLDAKPALAICVVPDIVYENCRLQSSVPKSELSDMPKTKQDRAFVKGALRDKRSGQLRMYDDHVSHLKSTLENLQQYGLSPDFRRQLKARMMAFEMPVQIVKESTLAITDKVRNGEPGDNPLSDRLWNFATAIYYKCGFKPWKTPWARDGVCYVGLAYKKAERNKTACCAAQMFLDSGDGIVFVGEFGPWYSEERKEFHLPPTDAEKLLRGTIETYQKLDGRPLKEIFLHARSGIDKDEYEGFLKACPAGVNLIAIRVKQDRNGLRLFRYDEHPNVVKRGQHPVQRGVFWRRTLRHGLLFTTGFKPRIATYDGWEIPAPLAITVQHGEADISQVARDILGLTKLNYNACTLGESQPITVKYSDRVGEILLANPELPRTDWRHNFKYYI